MAYVMALPAPAHGPGVILKSMYNVEFDVKAWLSPALLSDVQLVQSLLNIRFRTDRNIRSVKTGRILTSLPVDGICGTTTEEAILSYQRYIYDGATGRNAGRPDGVVQHAVATRPTSPVHIGYTIIQLNIHLAIVGHGTLPSPDIFPVEPLNSDLKRSLAGQGMN